MDSLKFDLMMMLHEKSGDDKQCDIDNSSSLDESLSTTNVNLVVALKWKSGDRQPAGLILWGPRMSVQDFTAIQLIMIVIFQSAPKWWNDRQTVSVIPKATPAAWLQSKVSRQAIQ